MNSETLALIRKIKLEVRSKKVPPEVKRSIVESMDKIESLLKKHLWLKSELKPVLVELLGAIQIVKWNHEAYIRVAYGRYLKKQNEALLRLTPPQRLEIPPNFKELIQKHPKLPVQVKAYNLTVNRTEGDFDFPEKLAAGVRFRSKLKRLYTHVNRATLSETQKIALRSLLNLIYCVLSCSTVSTLMLKPHLSALRTSLKKQDNKTMKVAEMISSLLQTSIARMALQTKEELYTNIKTKALIAEAPKRDELFLDIRRLVNNEVPGALKLRCLPNTDLKQNCD